MFGQMNDELATPRLEVQRKVCFKTMFPIDLEPEELDVELSCLRLRENAQQRYRRHELHDFTCQ
jgi:hypothetical protein